MTDDTGAYDAVISYQLNPSELTRGASYSAKLYYFNEETKLYAELRSKLPLTAADNYTVSIQAAEYFALSPDTQYGFQWELYEGTTLVNTQYQLVTTGNRRPQLRLRPIWQTPLLAVSRSRAGLSTFRGTSRSLPMSRRRTGSTAKPARALICMHQRGIRRQGIPSLDSPMSGITLCLLGILREKSTACTRFVFDAKIDGVRVSIGNQVAGAHHITLQTQIEGEPAPGSYLILFSRKGTRRTGISEVYCLRRTRQSAILNSQAILEMM